MRDKIILCLGFFLLATLTISCTSEGVAGFAPDHSHIAIITNAHSLYTTNLDGTVVNVVEPGEINPGFDVSFDPSGNRVLYATLNHICTANADGSEALCPWLELPPEASTGFLSYLPSGQFALAYQIGELGAMRIYQGNGELLPDLNQDNISHFFVTENAFKVRRGTEGTDWFVTPYRASPERPIRWVIVQAGLARSYSASSQGLSGPTDLGNLHPNALSLMENRMRSDITSGVLSPDGTKLALRTQDGGNQHSLYLVNLSAPGSEPVILVQQANFRIRFAFSPGGGEIVYESHADGRSVWVASADGSNQRKIADNASLPDWH